MDHVPPDPPDPATRAPRPQVPDARPVLPPFSLQVPDHPLWRWEPDYEPTVAPFLIRGYVQLHRGDAMLRNFYDAHATMEALAGRSMSLRQRVRRCYVLSVSHAAVGGLVMAREWADQALDLARLLAPFEEVSGLLYLRGITSRGMMRVRDSAADLRECLALLRERRAAAITPDPVDAALELDVLGLFANAEFFLARYDVAQRLIDDARAVAALVSDTAEHQVCVASLHWFQAYLWRWGDEPDRAIVPAATAANIYGRGAHPGSAARIHTLTAEIALDLAERMPEGSDRRGMLRLAWPHIRQALHMTRVSHDEVGRGVALLARARYSRLSGHNTARIASLTGVLRTAMRYDDLALRSQGLIALADELVADGDPEGALAHYREVIGSLDGGEMPALALPALRAVARLSRE